MVAVADLPETPLLPDHLLLGIVPFEVAAEGAEIQNFAVGLCLSLADNLALMAQQEQGISWVVPSEEVERSGSLSVAALGRNYGATVVVTGRLEALGERVRLTLSIEDILKPRGSSGRL